MSDVPTWRLFAFMDGDEDGECDERRRLADWQVEDALRWCRHRGYDHIYLHRDLGRTVRFDRASPVSVVHHPHFAEERDAEPGDAA